MRKRIGVLTSGGDSPGMNAAIRAVVRAAIGRGASVVGFLQGYEGPLRGLYREMDSPSVGGIIGHGGTILRSARSAEFLQPQGRRRAFEAMVRLGVEGLVVIGGDGSMRGALALHEETGMPVVGVPGSIDNDVSGSEGSIGFDTAVNTALGAIDRLRDTAYSHERVFVVEVMGRRNGFIATEAGLAGGAEAILLPELPFSLLEICDELRAAAVKGKKSSIIVVAEGAASALDIRDFIQANTGFEARYLVLGHMQRGGSPTAFDRVLALRFGALAANRLIDGAEAELVAFVAEKVVAKPLEAALKETRVIDEGKLLLAEVMAQ